MTTDTQQDAVTDAAAEERAALESFANAMGISAPADAPAEPTPEEVEAQRAAKAEADAAAAKQAEDDWLASVPPSVRDALGMVKSIDGRVRNMTGEVKALSGTTSELKAAFEAANAAKGAGGDAPSTAQIAAASGDAVKWKQMTEDFPEWAEAVEERLAAGIKMPAAQPVDVAAIRSEVKNEVAMELRAELVEDEHPGWQETVKTPDFKAWYTAQPQDVQALSGSIRVSDAKKLLKLYAERSNEPAPDAPATGEPAPAAPAKHDPKSRLEAAVPATTGKSVLRAEPMSEEEAAQRAFERIHGKRR